eukprot:403362488
MLTDSSMESLDKILNEKIIIEDQEYNDKVQANTQKYIKVPALKLKKNIQNSLRFKKKTIDLGQPNDYSRNQYIAGLKSVQQNQRRAKSQICCNKVLTALMIQTIPMIINENKQLKQMEMQIPVRRPQIQLKAKQRLKKETKASFPEKVKRFRELKRKQSLEQETFITQQKPQNQFSTTQSNFNQTNGFNITKSSFNPSILNRTPRLKDQEIQEMLRQYPVSQTQNTLENLRKQNHQIYQQVLDKCKNHHYIKRKDDPARQLDLNLYLEDYKQDKFNRTLEILRDLEFSDSKQMKKLFNYKMTGKMEHEQEAREVTYEYKFGIMDPSRQVAQTEKQNHIKRQSIKNKNSIN